MCGIAGYIGLDLGVGEAVLDRMARQLVHRGPDGQGVAVSGGLGLVHRRLAVADRADADRPTWSADGRWVLVYDGEVYNHPEIRDELTSLGHTFATQREAEVVLVAWEEWGIQAFDRFRGMFALAVADTSSGDVVLARDPFGIRSLYLVADGAGRVAFASEIRPVLAAAVLPRRPDDVSIYRYLRHGRQDDTERTFFAGVTRLLPGQIARITANGAVHRETYTRLRHELEWLAAAPRPYDQGARDQLYAAIVAAVRSRLAGGAPVGTTLSGDPGESTVVAMVDHLLAARGPAAGHPAPLQRSFVTVTSGEDDLTDRAIHDVTAVCGHRLVVHRVGSDADGLLDDLTDFIRTQEEPVGSLTPYLHYRVVREASRQVSVMLDGVGADELFAGHPGHRRVHLRELVRRRRYATAAAEVVRSAARWWPVLRPRAADRLSNRRHISADRLLDPGFIATHAGDGAHQEDGRGAGPVADPSSSDLKRRLTDDLFRDTLPALLRYADRNAHRFSVEQRSPYLDPPLVRLLWGLDTSAMISGGQDRRALRDATVGLLPSRVRRRRGTASGRTPAEAWLARMKNLVYDVLSSDSFGARPYVDQSAATASFRAFLSGRASADPATFWRLVNLELWLREFIDADPAVALETAVLRRDRPASGGGGSRRRGEQEGRPSAASEPYWMADPADPVVTPDGRWARYPLQVEPVGSEDDVAAVAGARVAWFFTDLAEAPPEVVAAVQGNRWYLFCSETVAAAAPAAGSVASAPAASDAVARHVSATVRGVVPPETGDRFGGTVVLDEPNRSVRGHDTDLPPERLAAASVDKPLGPDRQPAPLAVVCALPGEGWRE